MKNIIFIILGVIIFSSCSVKLPLRTTLNDSILLNKDIIVKYNITSLVPDGHIKYIYESKSGVSRINDEEYKYPVETGFKIMWRKYFLSKYNKNSDDTIFVNIKQLDFFIKEVSNLSKGVVVLTGSSLVVIEVHSKLEVEITYNGTTHKKVFDITSNDYKDNKLPSYGTNYYTHDKTSYQTPSEQKSNLIQHCYNKGITVVDDYINTILGI